MNRVNKENVNFFHTGILVLVVHGLTGPIVVLAILGLRDLPQVVPVVLRLRVLGLLFVVLHDGHCH